MGSHASETSSRPATMNRLASARKPCLLPAVHIWTAGSSPSGQGLAKCRLCTLGSMTSAMTRRAWRRLEPLLPMLKDCCDSRAPTCCPHLGTCYLHDVIARISAARTEWPAFQFGCIWEWQFGCLVKMPASATHLQMQIGIAMWAPRASAGARIKRTERPLALRHLSSSPARESTACAGHCITFLSTASW
jgi:hypothetical protein